MIRLDNVAKHYGGRLTSRLGRRVRALDGVSLEVAAGAALGIIGLNGAGKSTLLRVLLGYVRPTTGRVTIAGLPPRTYAQQRGIGYVPERVAIPRGWTVRGALTAYAMLANLGADSRERIAHTLRRLGLEALAERRVGTLSQGNLQRVAIGQTLIAERSLLVLDEPTDGLDPVWIVELRKIVTEWRAADPDRVLIIASHQLAEVERLCDRVMVLHDGKVRAEIDLGVPSPSPLEDRFLSLVAAWGAAP